MNIPRQSEKSRPPVFMLRAAWAVAAMVAFVGCKDRKAVDPASVPAPTPAPASPALSLEMPDALIGKWKKEGGEGWHVFESTTLHYWTDGTTRNNHKIRLRQAGSTWYIDWMDIERPPEKVELWVKDGKILMKTIPTSRMGPVNIFSGGFADGTFVKE